MIAFFITSGMPRRSPGLRLGNTLNIRYLFEHPRNNQSRLHIRHRKNRNIRLSSPNKNLFSIRQSYRWDNR